MLASLSMEWKRNINQIILGGCSLQQPFLTSIAFLTWMQLIQNFTVNL